MGKIAIVTDSNSGITQDQARELGISVIPMPFYINEKLYLEGITHRKSFMRDLRMMRLFLLHSRGRQMYADSGIHYWKSMMK